MSSIALFPCTFTPVAGVVGELSNSLGLKTYTDAQLLEETSQRYGIGTDNLKKMIYSKTSVFNQFTLEKEAAINMFRSILAEKLATPDNYLFSGFITSLIPARATHVLRVVIVDKKQARIERAIGEGLSKNEAKRAVRNHDVSAYNWTDFLFKREAYDSSLYDLVIPVESKTVAELIDEITKCYHKTSVLRTAESQQAVADMRLDAEIERLLLNNGHNMSVRSEAGNVVLTVHNSVFNYDKLADELTRLVEQIAGVKSVTVEQGADYTDFIYRKQKFELPSKVLFVDDEKEFVQTVSQRLISRDVGTYGVFNGEDALELIAEDRPDVMVLDLKMPGLHGVEVLRRTKELAPEVEVIILTGHGTAKDMQECMELGAFAYMNKPVNIEELSATIKAANEKVICSTRN